MYLYFYTYFCLLPDGTENILFLHSAVDSQHKFAELKFSKLLLSDLKHPRVPPLCLDPALPLLHWALEREGA